jgi:hypothetical protein
MLLRLPQVFLEVCQYCIRALTIQNEPLISQPDLRLRNCRTFLS